MKIFADGRVETEKGEPAFRSCWECNGAHEHLKKVNTLHVCLAGCGRYWLFDRFMDSFKSDKEILEWLESKGIKPGESTTKVDVGYRITKITFKRDKNAEA